WEAIGSLAEVLFAQGKAKEWKELMTERAQANDPDRLRSAAWALVTSSDPRFRDGATALTLAERAVALTQRTNSAQLEVLAAAYAETGDFSHAVSVQQEAMSLLTRDKDKTEHAWRLSLYQSGAPCAPYHPEPETERYSYAGGYFARI